MRTFAVFLLVLGSVVLASAQNSMAPAPFKGCKTIVVHLAAPPDSVLAVCVDWLVRNSWPIQDQRANGFTTGAKTRKGFDYILYGTISGGSLYLTGNISSKSPVVAGFGGETSEQLRYVTSKKNAYRAGWEMLTDLARVIPGEMGYQ